MGWYYSHVIVRCQIVGVCLYECQDVLVQHTCTEYYVLLTYDPVLALLFTTRAIGWTLKERTTTTSFSSGTATVSRVDIIGSAVQRGWRYLSYSRFIGGWAVQNTLSLALLLLGDSWKRGVDLLAM